MTDTQYHAMTDALSLVSSSITKDNVSYAYLFGSCARGTCTIHSDVDIQIILKDSYVYDKHLIFELISKCNAINPNSVDIHFNTEKQWREVKCDLFEEIRKDGIDIYGYLS